MSGRLIPFYSYDGSYLDHIAIRRAERLEEMGRVKVVRHRKGHVNRAVLLRGTGEPHGTNVRNYVGQAYSFHQPLPDGHRPWKLRPLQGGRSDMNLAPVAVRPIFLRVLLDCLVGSAADNLGSFNICQLHRQPRRGAHREPGTFLVSDYRSTALKRGNDPRKGARKAPVAHI